VFAYSVFGLSVQSELCLPELGRSSDPAAVTIRRGAVGGMADAEGPVRCISSTPDEAVLVWGRTASVAIRGGVEMIVDVAEGIPEQVLRLLVLGPALGVLLHQRGMTVLHASVVAQGGAAVAFLGPKGAGKSTTAATLCANGYTLLADDVLALDPSAAEEPRVLPGFRQIKLWPDAAAAVGSDPNTLPLLHPEGVKRGYVGAQFRQAACPLRSIYLLETGENCRLEAVAGQERVIELVRHSYAMRFLGKAGVTALHFRQCVELAARVSILRLHRPRDLNRLDELVAVVDRGMGVERDPSARSVQPAVAP
jgi:hypothetical protein